VQPTSIEEICRSLVQDPKAVAAVLAGRSYVPLAALLEHPLASVQSNLEAALASAGLQTADVETISLRELLLYVLPANELGTYWGNLGLSWIESGFPLDESLAVALESLADNKKFDQNARHRAFVVTKRWRRSNPTLLGQKTGSTP
jgi:hypothetical protein